MENSSFCWPREARAAVSLSFDDARESQLDCGIPLFDGFGVKATFYLSLRTAAPRAEEWKAVASNGHELGNHSKTHPCSLNFDWVERALEDMTLDDIELELVEANLAIRELTGVTPRTFAYPCGQTFVGRGADSRSYVPVVARHFEVGRAFNSETDNDPVRCDLWAIASTALDGASFSDVEQWVETAVRRGRWLVLTGHEIGSRRAHQTTETETLERFCELARKRPEVWVGSVAEVGAYLHAQRAATSTRSAH